MLLVASLRTSIIGVHRLTVTTLNLAAQHGEASRLNQVVSVLALCMQLPANMAG
jgi:hypothetical protein